MALSRNQSLLCGSIFLESIILLALFAGLFLTPSLALVQMLSTFEISIEAIYGGGATTEIYTCTPRELVKSVPKDFAYALGPTRMGKLLDGRIVQVMNQSNQCVNVYDEEHFPYGRGSQNNALVPFISASSSGEIPFGTTAFLQQLANTTLPNGETHNGCVRIDGTCTEDNCIALFTLTRDETLRRLHPIVNITAPSTCTLLNYSVNFPPNWTRPPSPPPTPTPPMPLPPSPALGTSLAFIATLSAASVVLLALLICSCAAFFVLRKCRKKRRPDWNLFGGLQVFSYAELRMATSDFRFRLRGGSSAEVYRGKLESRTVAVKKLKPAANEKTTHQEFIAEVQGLGQMIHVNLVRLLGYSHDPNRPRMLVYEFVHGGSLQSLLYGEERMLVSFERRLSIALGIARGVEYCHHSVETAIIHRNIKPANILMTSADETGIPKVSDFGLAQLLDPLDKGSGSFIHLKAKLPPQLGTDASSPPSTGSSRTSFSMSSSTFSFGSWRSLSFGSSNNSSPTASTPPSPSSPPGDVPLWYTNKRKTPRGNSTRVAGTLGYIDPEYQQTFRPTLKSDVYSFGIVLLELIMGVEPNRIYEILQVQLQEMGDGEKEQSTQADAHTYEFLLRKFLKQGEAAVVAKVSCSLGEEGLDPHQVYGAMVIAHQCLQNKGRMRPSMRKVVRMFENLKEDQSKPA